MRIARHEHVVVVGVDLRQDLAASSAPPRLRRAESVEPQLAVDHRVGAVIGDGLAVAQQPPRAGIQTADQHHVPVAARNLVELLRERPVELDGRPSRVQNLVIEREFPLKRPSRLDHRARSGYHPFERGEARGRRRPDPVAVRREAHLLHLSRVGDGRRGRVRVEIGPRVRDADVFLVPTVKHGKRGGAVPGGYRYVETRGVHGIDANLRVTRGEHVEGHQYDGEQQQEQPAALHDDLLPPRLRRAEGVVRSVGVVPNVDPEKFAVDVLEFEPVEQVQRAVRARVVQEDAQLVQERHGEVGHEPEEGDEIRSLVQPVRAAVALVPGANLPSVEREGYRL